MRTPEGKAVSRRKALPHRLLAKVTLMKHGQLKEDGHDFERPLRRQQDEWQPLGFRDGQLLEAIATSCFRLPRALRHETGAICRRVKNKGEPALVAWRGPEVCPENVGL